MSHFLYLVRHGEQQNAEHGLPDGPLSTRGKRQARAIASRLATVPFDAAWHSPLQRAQETASIMTKNIPNLEAKPTALLMDGSVATQVGVPGAEKQQTVGIEYPSGIFKAMADLDDDGAVVASGNTRTARLISRGEVCVPASIWDPSTS